MGKIGFFTKDKWVLRTERRRTKEQTNNDEQYNK